VEYYKSVSKKEAVQTIVNCNRFGIHKKTIMKNEPAKLMKMPEKHSFELSGKVIEVYKKSNRFHSKILISPKTSEMIISVRRKMNPGDEFNINVKIVVRKKHQDEGWMIMDLED